MNNGWRNRFSAVGQHDGDRGDHAVGRARRGVPPLHPAAPAVQPHAGRADGRRPTDVRLRAVADHPGPGQPHPDPVRGDREDARVRLGDVGLLGDDPVGDVPVQPGPFDLRLLQPGLAVAHHHGYPAGVLGDAQRARHEWVEAQVVEDALAQRLDQVDRRDAQLVPVPDRLGQVPRRGQAVGVSTNPKMRPARAATTEAVVRSPVNRHTAARSTRPPSSGAAGTRLKIASARLVTARYAATATTSRLAPVADSAPVSAPKRPPSTALVPGPTTAMANSAPGVRGSLRSSATPPSSQSVIASTWTPLARATRACASSWTRMDARNSAAATSPAAKYRAALCPG